MKPIGKTCQVAVLTSALFAAPLAAQEAVNLKVVGTWGYLNTWNQVEKPFWTEELKAASNGKITVEALPMTEVGLKGFEVMRMLQLGVFDGAHGIISYLGDDPVAEGADLAGVVQTWDEAKAAVAAYEPVLAESFDKTYDAKLLGVYPFPSQLLYCNAPISGLADLKGKKIRSYSKSMSDLFTGLGATPVTIAFGEVVPALQLGTVDCAVSGTLPSYTSGWGEATTHLVRLSTGYAFSFAAVSKVSWDRMDEETRDIIASNAGAMIDRAWEIGQKDDEMGIACLTDGPCEVGDPAGLVDVALSDADRAQLADVLQATVLESFGARCGAACSATWNETIGRAVHLTIAE
ncbi:transporter [Pseudooceanicola sp. 216_PA32_1]|uniref:Transporter n=1 Tax=Pseudooceanicola pacificus TaxID=2676438 RepID=A0A844W2E9_9RHOB|nr:TRAP transporter substrate-binding protein [Pseudooceanicola pacificus]MWB77957.1 transporter [Pseudooceanicola pacificus]